jgi:flagellar hook assembly protein FlgD
LSIIAPVSLPNQIILDQNYPNPFNPMTTISYEIPKGDFVDIGVYNMNGNKIATLVSEFQTPGVKSYQWNGTNDYGNNVSAGVYIYTIQAGNHRQSKKMILLK